MQLRCIITGKQTNQLTCFDEGKKRALNSQTVRAKVNPHIEPTVDQAIDNHQALTQ